ncbi:restriction endonuclease FokI C-terminal domain-containing protein [Radiobacillus sp. PE A8.2]|uniref:restriction endonuclease FokI C-terminal domain-containing protein n=1 Tax=Radiobacillus sp. PE A8.2 TaxID=3380349 RepID=UPI00388E0EED
MKNYWFVSRPKRKLIPVPEVFSAFMAHALNLEWKGQVGKHINFEDELEKQGLKRKGDRRDQGGSGGRTYASWLYSLGLFFNKDGKVHTTLAGEAIINGESPVKILKNQVLKFQYPSSYSIRSGVNIDRRFRIRPFRFILKLLLDERIRYLTEEELAKIVITEAEDETDKCFNYIVERIISFRESGDSILPKDFNLLYPSKSGVQSFDRTVAMLRDIANTYINWIEYTQLATRVERELVIIPGKESEIENLLNDSSKLLPRYEDEEYFQRRYGLDPWHRKDTRDLNNAYAVTADSIARKIVRAKFLSMATQSPITTIDTPVIEKIYYSTGITHSLIEEELASFVNGALDSFEASYYDMALKGREKAREFEIATVELFNKAFGFKSEHVGDKGKHPDVLVLSSQYGGIIDTKAYASYSISNDHKNRMIYNYIPTYQEECDNLQFFMYIAAGFSSTFDKQVKDLAKESGINGSGITVNNIIKLAREYSQNNWDHRQLKDLFQMNREIGRSDYIN